MGRQNDLEGPNGDNHPRKHSSEDEVDGESTKGDGYYGYGFKEDKSLWVRFECCKCCEIRFNPVVSFFAILLIWGFAAWCIVMKEDVPFQTYQAWIVDCFSWLYIGSQDFWALFVVIVYFSPYANVKLGKPDEKPEYNDVTWFVMLFACGISTGLFFYGVAEPVWHYSSANRYTADATTPDNTLAQIAMNLTLYHWGIHGWVVYCILGMLIALLAYREGLPMTIKSCFYPLIGDRIFGWMGDVLDLLSIMTTLFGVCTSLGLGVKQLNKGLYILDPDLFMNDDTTTQVIIIWIITAVATVSTASGMGLGIRRLSEFCFCVGMFVMLVCLFMDNTWYLLNLYIQSIGYYFQYIMVLGWHTDAFEQLGPSPAEEMGRVLAVDASGNTLSSDGSAAWMDSWTMFYWGWWIAWSPFVGIFIAKISRGRTVREFINGTLTAPIIYSFMWMVIFGGSGIRMERESALAGYCCPREFDMDETSFLPFDNMTSAIVAQSLNQTVIDSMVAKSLLCDTDCGTCAQRVVDRIYVANNATYDDLLMDYDTLGAGFGSTSVDRKLARISCHATEEMWFDLMRSYTGIGDFLSVFSLIAIIFYFVTSSDSGSLVIDCLSANGDPEPPRPQRIFWALMEGATATALLVAGGTASLSALQAASIVSGLPYTFIICILCVSLWRALQVAAGDLDPQKKGFEIGLFDPLFVRAYRDIRAAEECKWFGMFCLNIVLAPWTAAKSTARIAGKPGRAWAYAIPAYMLFIAFIVLHICNMWVDGCWAIAWFFYMAFATFMCSVRVEVRGAYDIDGNAVEDFFACLFLYPLAAVQMDLTTDSDREMSGSSADIENGAEALGMKQRYHEQPPEYGDFNDAYEGSSYSLDHSSTHI